MENEIEIKRYKKLMKNSGGREKERNLVKIKRETEEEKKKK